MAQPAIIQQEPSTESRPQDIEPQETPISGNRDGVRRDTKEPSKAEDENVPRSRSRRSAAARTAHASRTTDRNSARGQSPRKVRVKPSQSGWRSRPGRPPGLSSPLRPNPRPPRHRPNRGGGSRTIHCTSPAPVPVLSIPVENRSATNIVEAAGGSKTNLRSVRSNREAEPRPSPPPPPSRFPSSAEQEAAPPAAAPVSVDLPAPAPPVRQEEAQPRAAEPGTKRSRLLLRLLVTRASYPAPVWRTGLSRCAHRNQFANPKSFRRSPSFPTRNREPPLGRTRPAIWHRAHRKFFTPA